MVFSVSFLFCYFYLNFNLKKIFQINLGALVIRQPNDPNYSLYDVDLAEHVVVLNDWLDQLFSIKFTADLHDSGDESPSSILINGRGGDMTFLMTPDKMPPAPPAPAGPPMSSGHKSMHGHRGHGKPMPPMPPPPPPPGYHKEHHELPRAEFTVAKGRRYRFRMINAGIGFCPLQVSIDAHTLTIISLDGNPVVPFQVSSFIILAGERVDFVLTSNAYPDAYWIKVKGFGDCEPLKIFQTAILRYGTSPKGRPNSKITYETAVPDVPGKVNLNCFSLFVEIKINHFSLFFISSYSIRSMFNEPSRTRTI